MPILRLFPLGDLLHRPPGLHARQARLDQRVGAARLGIADLAQQPVLARFLAARLQPDQQPFALHPLAIEDEVEMSLFQILLRLALNRRRSEEHTSELQSLMRISYAVFCLKKKKKINIKNKHKYQHMQTRHHKKPNNN